SRGPTTRRGEATRSVSRVRGWEWSQSPPQLSVNRITIYPCPSADAIRDDSAVSENGRSEGDYAGDASVAGRAASFSREHLRARPPRSQVLAAKRSGSGWVTDSASPPVCL